MPKQTISSYNKSASRYEQKWKAYLRHTHQKLLESLQTDKDDLLLDLSGGTGLLAEKLYKGPFSFRHLVVNDPSREMLAVAQERLPDGAEISFTGHLAHRLPFRKNYFDSVLSLNSFHYYNNQQQVLDLIHFVLKPGGTLYLLDWNRSGFFRLINQLISWFSSEHIDTRTLGELKDMLPKSGFRIRSTESWNWRYWKFLYIEAET